MNTSSEIEQHGCNRHSSQIIRQTVHNYCGLLFAFPPTGLSRTDRLFRRGIDGYDGCLIKRQTRGLDLAAEHETVVAPTGFGRRKLLSDLWTGRLNHQTLLLVRYSRYIGYPDNQEPPIPYVSDFFYCTKLGPLPASHWQSL